MRFCSFAIAMLSMSGVATASSITDLSTWTLIEDPADPGMSASINLAGVAQLMAVGSIASGTDIGYASIHGVDVASSIAGYYFDPAEDFSVAVDFDLQTDASLGGGGIGFGIGEDTLGTDSAGITLGFIDGTAALFATTARIDDVDGPIGPFTAGFGAGRLFLEYNSVTGDIVVGVNAAKGTPAPDVWRTFGGIQNQWDDEPLLVSFFLRSQSLSIFPGLTAGNVNAYFSNFQVLSGSPITIVPEPTTGVLAALALLASWRLPRRR